MIHWLTGETQDLRTFLFEHESELLDPQGLLRAYDTLGDLWVWFDPYYGDIHDTVAIQWAKTLDDAAEAYQAQVEDC
jgi:hypothetical protein